MHADISQGERRAPQLQCKLGWRAGRASKGLIGFRDAARIDAERRDCRWQAVSANSPDGYDFDALKADPPNCEVIRDCFIDELDDALWNIIAKGLNGVELIIWCRGAEGI